MSNNWSTFVQDNYRYPETVEEAVDRLMELLNSEEKSAIAAMQEKNLFELHFTIGMAIRNAGMKANC